VFDVAKNIHEDVLHHVFSIVDIADLPLAPVHEQWMIQFAKSYPVLAIFAKLQSFQQG
jgi:hypothetical protein